MFGAPLHLHLEKEVWKVCFIYNYLNIFVLFLALFMLFLGPVVLMKTKPVSDEAEPPFCWS